jgi:dihydrofolate synthase/folylpolyglutamate synthase
VIGPQAPEAQAVLEAQAGERQAPVFLLGRDFATTPVSGGFSFRGLGLDLPMLRPGLAGTHQHQNLSLALAAAAVLRRQGMRVPEAALRAGIESVRWPGRLEWWQNGRTVLLDGAHNEGGARVLAAYLAEWRPEQVRWVVALKGDKRPADILGPLLPAVGALYCTVPPAESAVPPETLAAMGIAAGLPARVFTTVAEAMKAALADCRPGEFVLVAGSLFLVGAAREFLRGGEALQG